MNGGIRLAMAGGVVAVVSAASTPPPALPTPAPSIQNGDFEGVQIGAPYFSSDPLDVPGWTHAGVTGNGLIWALGYADGGGSVTAAGHGDQFVTLGGEGTAAGAASWTNGTIAGLTAGAPYELTFDIANEDGDAGGVPGAAAGPEEIEAAFGAGAGASGSYTAPAPAAPAQAAGYWNTWLPETLDFVATGPTASITFSVPDVPEQIGLDNVQIIPDPGPETVADPTQAPEPATLAVLAIGLVGLASARQQQRRRRRR